MGSGGENLEGVDLGEGGNQDGWRRWGGMDEVELDDQTGSTLE